MEFQQVKTVLKLIVFTSLKLIKIELLTFY